MSSDGSETSGPPGSHSGSSVPPTGGASESYVQELENGSTRATMAPKRVSPRGTNLDDETPSKRQRLGADSAPSATGSINTPAVREDQDLSSVRLSLNGFVQPQPGQPSNPIQTNGANTMSVYAPSDLASLKDKTSLKDTPTTDKRVDPFQAALQQAKRETNQVGKTPVTNEIPPLSGTSNTKYSLWTCGQQLKDILDIYFRTPLDDKPHTELRRKFPKSVVPALTFPELDNWLVLVGGKEKLGQLRWEQNLQLTMRNYMDAAGPLCILLQHLQADPSSVTENAAISLILKSLRLLGHSVASINKQRRQEIVKSCNITDVTQLAKQSDPMQTYLFGESKASELNFVGDLAEKVSKAVKSSKKKQADSKSKTTHQQSSGKSFQRGSSHFKSKTSSSSNYQPFRKTPFRGKRDPERESPEKSRFNRFKKESSTQASNNKKNQFTR